ncbi:MAG: hypothetical protein SPLUMA1_SPLUMAMAG1_00796 [uncultured Sulfurimonas sp.]|nr:MAG: hypothetical protein SPLUMA1_SPLUMAMAG1_00796 [uncultured Sulfurimonas sp.]
MELKDVILSTLAEMEETNSAEEQRSQIQTPSKEDFFEASPQHEPVHEQTSSTTESELIYLNSIRERLLVLFEGFQAPNNSNIEAKVDMTLNFLEYTLATIDIRVKKLEKEV